MGTTEQAITLLDQQQREFKKTELGYLLCEQVKDICRMEPDAAELIAQDLELPELSIRKCVKQLDSYADAHKSGNRSVITPKQAETIIRKFYGLPERKEPRRMPEPVSVQPVAAEASGATGASGLPSLFDLLEEEV